MVPVKQTAAEFLANMRIAVTGAFRTPKDHGSNIVYKRLRDRGYQVFAINPSTDQVEGDRCYHDLRSVPGGVEAVLIGTRPETAEATMRECADLGIKHVDAPRARHRQRVHRGHPIRPGARDHRDRRGLPTDVQTHRRFRAQDDAAHARKPCPQTGLRPTPNRWRRRDTGNRRETAASVPPKQRTRGPDASPSELIGEPGAAGRRDRTPRPCPARPSSASLPGSSGAARSYPWQLCGWRLA
jgi:predicted CoA-binding protein